jgi:predicted phosphodiesterase
MWEPPKVDADVTVLAGDIHNHTHALEWIEKYIDGPVVYVLGNHEFYWAEMHGIRAELKRQAKGLVHVLDNDSIEIHGETESVRFLGSTLWTNYKLHGAGAMGDAMHDARHFMIDHSQIRCSPLNYFTPSQALGLHNEAASWLSSELGKPYDGKTVVVTHHLPSMLSVADRFKGSVLSAAFASNLDHLVERADLWIHGHTHDGMDYQLGKCRVVCNPRGYVSHRYEGTKVENKAFNPELVIEL